MRIILKYCICCFICLLITCIGLCQTFGNDDALANDEPFENDNDYPVDGGASILLAAGIAYGIKRVRDVSKKSSDHTDKET